MCPYETSSVTTLQAQAKQQHISSIVAQHRLRHIAHMKDYCLPRKLLVCAADNKKHRWNDLMIRDLKDCGLDEDLQDLAHLHDEHQSKVVQEN